MGLIGFLYLFGAIISICIFIAILRFILDVPDALIKIADELEKMNNK